jgi:hypothetical protein
VYAAAWAAHAVGFNRQRLWAAHHGSAVPLVALLAFAALRSPCATLLTVPAPPALRDLAGAASGIATGGAAGLLRHASDYAFHGFVAALWPSWLPRPGLGPQGRRDGVKTRSGSRDGGGGGGVSGSRPSSQSALHRTRQPQAGSRSSRHAGGISGKGGRTGGGVSQAARQSWTSSGAAALLPMRLGARQLLVAMAAPPLLSLVGWMLAHQCHF